jgi:predicted HAD superfamily Cof-like phosphohydrolase
MKKLDSLNQVAEFHSLFGAPVHKNPLIPSEDRCKLRVELLQEELNELQEAIDEINIVEVADALCDLQYVLAGAILEFGLGEKFVNLFDEVQRSNMSKACSSVDEAKETIQHYKTHYGVDAFYVEDELTKRFIVKREGDDKILKSINYSPANLKDILKHE